MFSPLVRKYVGVVDVGTGDENDYRHWLVIQTGGFTTGM